MAKRRNLKKEKALRNQAYARKFRKRSTSRFNKRRSYNSGGQNSDNADQDFDDNDGGSDRNSDRNN
ncbi:MAG: hypothetical protein VKK04_20720 [Synechococcales bacterium]|nr:hypothetical protein [Synechococcales bacterium]